MIYFLQVDLPLKAVGAHAPVIHPQAIPKWLIFSIHKKRHRIKRLGENGARGRGSAAR
jgi:hypothetical protein